MITKLAGDTDISPKSVPMLYDICNIGQDLHQLPIGYADKKYLKKTRELTFYATKAWIIVSLQWFAWKPS